MSRLTKGETVVEPPHHHSVDGRPMLAVATGIPCEDGRICGLLAYRQRPEEELTRLLNIARPGQTGETYAFDEHGFFVSESRFISQLRTLSLAPRGAARCSRSRCAIRASISPRARKPRSRATRSR